MLFSDLFEKSIVGDTGKANIVNDRGLLVSDTDVSNIGLHLTSPFFFVQYKKDYHAKRVKLSLRHVD